MALDFHSVFKELYPKLLFLGTRLVGEADAEDILQDVFAEYWKKSENFTAIEQAYAYLYKSMHNRCLNIIKHKTISDKYAKLEQELSLKRLEYYSPEHSDALKNIEIKELRKKLANAIGMLPDKCRQAFILSYLYDMPNKEIATVMNVSKRTIDVHIYKALKILRERLAIIAFLIFFHFIR